MAMLRILHKINLGHAPLQPQTLFPKIGRVEEPMARQLHTKQLSTHADFASNNVLRRSLLGLVHCYTHTHTHTQHAHTHTDTHRRIHTHTQNKPECKRSHGETRGYDSASYYSKRYACVPATQQRETKCIFTESLTFCARAKTMKVCESQVRGGTRRKGLAIDHREEMGHKKAGAQGWRA